MTFFARMSRSRILRLPRRALVAFVLATYLITGAMHGLCGLDVTNASVETIMSIADRGIGHSDMGTVADNHCHGCFSMTAEPLVFTTKPVSLKTRALVFHDDQRREWPGAIDPRPPNS
ncbi:hypothetical protein RPMA_20130 [Tardiphaga alba]|uniref:DUF2946 domain-containing protein n=1 Tax=Tardiphaga alba TaxID=340268 RepID=A0ABX8AAU2_9BRAD|nr:hypothetical protein [Tardiphaga alba]QUS40889.1 hypothetical protein RPMA_20130 [Tardiphaga alba]